MRDTVLVVGAGLAGLSAATELARAGLPVLVVDQAQAVGGAIHRQPLPGVRSIASGAQKRRWAGVMAGVAAQGGRITLALGTRFGGVDHTGAVLLTGAMNRLIRPRALALALGARESVQPRPGWTLPGVETAGSLQTRLKTLAEAPAGRVLLAGSGPLLLALGAELVKLGRPPLAILEAGRPFARPLAALRLPRSYWAEAATYLTRLRLARVPILTGTHLTAIRAEGGALVAEATGGRRLTADHIALHDGIRSNDIGLPDCATLPVVRLGDCREALGARAALADGRAGGAALAARLLGRPEPAPDAELARQRAAQALLAQLYAHDGAARLADLPGDTVICRCEARTVNDLRALGPSPRARQLRLDGRFAMGPCQGRFCGDWVARLAAADNPGPDTPTPGIGAPRWPARPIAVADLLAATDETEGETR
ncbi:FAD-dependent oxidoreductase [Phaeovulum sp. NW3]|uniref:FAD-dependent oxidoreductase n=1 Tax=Phaeovulum sp. NW3 TaxID=2934933 RepID=UPI00201FD0AE|nr:FAD-dependent oxidoreductase [Phaeovulum sp. NW3]MCL7463527.1 FAD-dependent oxidoreductase [Phaeovulum sp. NW3]